MKQIIVIQKEFGTFNMEIRVKGVQVTTTPNLFVIRNIAQAIREAFEIIGIAAEIKEEL